MFVANGDSSLNFGGPGVVVFAPDAAAGGVLLTGVSTPSQPAPSDVVVDPADGDLFVADALFDGHVRRYVSDGAPVPTYTEDPAFSVPAQTANNSTALAIDPATGDLLVAYPDNQQIKRYNQTTGVLLGTIDAPPSFQLMSVAPDGSIWTQSGGINGKPGPIDHFSASGTMLGTLDHLGSQGPTLSLAVDPTTGAVVVAVAGRIKRYSAAGVFQSEAVAHGSTSALAIDGDSGRLYEWTGGQSFGGEINAYVPAAYPGVEPPTVSAVTPEGFHVSTEVDPGEEEDGSLPAGSEMRFEYRLLGSEPWSETPNQPVNAPASFGADIVGLEPNRTYEVRAVAFNVFNTHPSDATNGTTVATAPVVYTSAATDVSETSATLNGTVHTIGLQTTYHFEYGPTTAYGARIPATIEAVAGSAYEAKSFLRSITGLRPATTYHFRLVATNSAGTTKGADRTFTTTAAGGVVQRAYEQVTPVNKPTSLVIRFGSFAKADGEGLVYSARGGPESSLLNVFWMSRRGAEDWHGDIPLDPPLGASPSVLGVATTIAVSTDFTHAFVISNKALAPGSIESDTAGNLYVVDLETRSYQLVASFDPPGSGGLLSFVGTKQNDKFIAAAPDMNWVVFASDYPLVAGAPQAALYRWSKADGLEVVSVLPDGDMTGAVRRSTDLGEQRSVSADGSRVYFTASGGGSEEGVFLREGDESKAISVSHVPGDPSTPQRALFLGSSENGRFAFFAALKGPGQIDPPAALTDDAPGKVGDLYRYDADDGSLEYLGAQALFEGLTLAWIPKVSSDGTTIYFNAVSGSGAEELTVWRNGALHSIYPARVQGSFMYTSPNGRYLVFPDNTIRIYDADSGQLRCAACFPDGTPASGGLPNQEAAINARQPQVVDNSGTVYFDTTDRLVAGDVNGSSDVYAYRDGAAELISPGNAPFDALFLDISEDGKDVFFQTAQKLVGRDSDESTDIYDARVGGGLPLQSPPPPQECLRDDCKATPSAGPELPFGGSEALSGPGNVAGQARKRCAAGTKARKVKGRTRCVKHPNAKKKKSAKRAKNYRRPGR